MKVKIENLVKYSIISFGLLPIIPNKLKGILLVLIFLTSFKYFLSNHKEKYFSKTFFINSILFFTYVVSLLYSTDITQAFRKLGPAISIIIFPIIFFVFLDNYKIKRNVIYTTINLLSISTIVFLIIYYIYLFFAPHPNNPALDYPSTFFFRRSLINMPIWDIHPIYLSLFIVISIFNFLRISKSTIYTNKTLFISSLILQLVLMITLFLMSSKAAVLFLLLTGILIYSKNKFQTIIIGVSLFSLLAVLIFLIPQTKTRFKELIHLKTYNLENLDYKNSTQIRIVIWQTTLEKINESPIFGYGIGDVKSVLDESYKDKSPVLLEKNYNSHNQYLGIWLSVGVIGVLFFVYFLFYNFNSAIHSKDYFFLAILIFYTFSFLTENILERQLGAMLFFFLVNLFGSYNFKKSINKD